VNKLQKKRDSAPAHAILVGLPGAGKSTVGRARAARLGCDFVDLDDEIERAAGISIPLIFEEGGEAAFRQLERLATAEIAKRDQLVLAPGGGWITQPSTVALLRPPSRLIFLRIRPSVALARVRASGASRPLLEGAHPEGKIEALLRDRQSFYECADMAVDAELSLLQVVSSCEQWLASDGWRV
jgi:shikimate kinase